MSLSSDSSTISFSVWKWILLGLLLAWSTGCSFQQEIVRTPDSEPTSVASATKTIPKNATETPSAVPIEPAVVESTPEKTDLPSPLQRTRYLLTASLDYQAHLISVQQTVDYRNTTPEVLYSLAFVLEPHRLADGFALHSVKSGDGSAIEQFSLKDGRLFVVLPEALPVGSSLSLELAYAYYLPNRLAPFGYVQQQTNVADWYAFLPPYHPEEGWMLRDPAGVGESLIYDIADYQVEIRLLGNTSGLRVAAPAPVERAGDMYRYTRQMARNFVFSVGEYALLEGVQGQTQIHLYAFPDHVDSGWQSLGCVSEALDVFSILFGDPSLPQITVVETAFPDGMEYDGLFFLNYLYFEYPGSGKQSGLCTLSVHETAHQWWYRLVSNDPSYEPWLDEALCTYSELLFYESRYPDLIPWWWGYRVDKHDPKGWVNDTIYQHSEYRPYVNAVYLQGVRFLKNLRSRVGDAVMFDFLYQYAQAYRYQQVTEEDFFNLLDTLSEEDFQPLVERYFSP